MMWTTNTNQSEWTDSSCSVNQKAPHLALPFRHFTRCGGVALALTCLHINEISIFLHCHVNYIWICVLTPPLSCDKCLSHTYSPVLSSLLDLFPFSSPCVRSNWHEASSIYVYVCLFILSCLLVLKFWLLPCFDLFLFPGSWLCFIRAFLPACV